MLPVSPERVKCCAYKNAAGISRRQRVYKWKINRGGPVIANVTPRVPNTYPYCSLFPHEWLPLAFDWRIVL